VAASVNGDDHEEARHVLFALDPRGATVPICVRKKATLAFVITLIAMPALDGALRLLPSVRFLRAADVVGLFDTPLRVPADETTIPSGADSGALA
jgi:hypothetical protein